MKVSVLRLKRRAGAFLYLDGSFIGKRFEEAMKNAGYTNIQLTKKCELSKNAVGNYLNNQIPNAVILYKISQILGITMEYLISGKKSTELTSEEQELLEAYRSAELEDRNAARKQLDLPKLSSGSASELSGKSSILEDGKEAI